MEEILKYFSGLNCEQREQFAAIGPLYSEWNTKINVISRKDIANLYEHHILHSLAVAKELHFTDDTDILDFGTGGGFPGIPLAIMFPKCNFKLIDRTAKKIRVVEEVAKSIGLQNVVAQQLSGEEEQGKYDFIVSRAVMPLPDLIKITNKNISRKQRNAMPNGVICLKGGDIRQEIASYQNIAEVTSVSDYFDEEWFKEKYLIYIPL